jgi:hypothetical protein
LLWATTVATAFAWEKGTHAYIADLLRKKAGAQNIEEMYGAMVPDIAGYNFSDAGIWLETATHTHSMWVWNAARSGPERSGAAGFVSHNDIWGADFIAHSYSLLTNGYPGYIVQKAAVMHELMKSANAAYNTLFGSPLLQDVGIMICHNLAEAAGDIVLKRNDPEIGQKVVSIVRRPNPTVLGLMIKAYASGLASGAGISLDAAKAFITQAESEFRMGAIGYGYLLQGDEQTLRETVTAAFVSIGTAFLTYLNSQGYSIPIPDPATMTSIVSDGMTVALDLLSADYMTAVNATVDYLADTLKDYGIK